jgi:hypothetical protein
MGSFLGSDPMFHQWLEHRRTRKTTYTFPRDALATAGGSNQPVSAWTAACGRQRAISKGMARMRAMNRKSLLVLTAVVEGATGLCLLVLPALPFALLLGWQQAELDANFIGRIAGASLLALGIASWMARNDAWTPAQRGLLTGILVYNAATAILLACAGAVLKMSGVLLWPAVALHAILAVWCFRYLWLDRIERDFGGAAVEGRTTHR